ncbi:MAG: zinc ribbon domain-containing protein [Clostridiales bacterium]|jgi:hypothetical protein|nr:zinc ribbon domain-containing protein [Clostridiales bacterium]
MYCNKCGTQLPDDARFCSICGAPQSPDTPAANLPKGEPDYNAYNDVPTVKKKKKLRNGGYGKGLAAKISIVLVTLVLLAGVGYFGYRFYLSYADKQIAAQKEEIGTAVNMVMQGLVNPENKPVAIEYMTENMTYDFDATSEAFSRTVFDKLDTLTKLLGELLPGIADFTDELRNPTIMINDYELASMNEEEVNLSGSMDFHISFINQTVSINYTSKLIRLDKKWLVEDFALFNSEEQPVSEEDLITG